MLRFIYMDECEEGAMEAMADHLLAAATRYQLGRLQVMSELHLTKTLTVIVHSATQGAMLLTTVLSILTCQVENAAERLLLAETNSADQLKEEALRFITANTVAVSQTEGYKKLSNQPILFMELFEASSGVTEARGKKRARDEEADESGGLTPAVVRGMKVGQLRAELSKRQLAVDGVRQVLMQRLEEAISSTP